MQAKSRNRGEIRHEINGILLETTVYSVRNVEIDTAASCVRRNGETQYLRTKTFHVLLHLIAHRERVVTKEELLREVWNGTAVTDDTLVQSIVDIRKAVGDDPRDPWFIRTIPRTGYHLIATLEGPGPVDAEPATPNSTTREEVPVLPAIHKPWRRFLPHIAITAIVVIGGTIWFSRTAAPASTPGNLPGTSTLRDDRRGRDHMTDNLEAYEAYRAGVKAADHMENNQAIASFQRAIALDPQFAMAYARIGYTYSVRWTLHDRARPYLAKALELGDRLSERERLYVLAWQATAEQSFDKAIDHFRLLVSRYPTDVEAHVGLGRLLAGEERLNEAMDVLRRGLVLDPDSPELNNAMGSAASYLGRHEEAIAFHRRYVSLEPNAPNAHDSLGLSYQWAGDYDKALAAYSEALRLNPRFEIAMIHRANAYWQTGRIREATQEIHRYIEIAPSNIERWRGHGDLSNIYRSIGDLDRAAAEVKKATSAGGDPLFYETLLAAARGDAETLRRIVETMPSPEGSNRGARYSARLQFMLRAEAARVQGDSAKAIEYAREAVRRQPPIYLLDDYEDLLCDTLAAFDRHAEAIAEYQRVLKLNANRGRTRFKLARSFDAMGRRAEARVEYERFLTVWKHADADAPELVAAKAWLRR